MENCSRELKFGGGGWWVRLIDCSVSERIFLAINAMPSLLAVLLEMNCWTRR